MSSVQCVILMETSLLKMMSDCKTCGGDRPPLSGGGWIRKDGTDRLSSGYLAKCPECNGGSWEEINKWRVEFGFKPIDKS